VTPAYLTLSQVLSHIDNPVDEGRAREVEGGGVSIFEAT
jgi:hypothetical protein